MKWMAGRVAPLLTIAMAVMVLTGCPLLTNPRPLVQPAVISLNESKPMERISITNTGSGILKWTATTSEPWLLLSFQDSTYRDEISGATDTVDLLRVHLVSALLPNDTDSFSTEIILETNNGIIMIPVAVNKVLGPVISVEPEILEFANNEAEKVVEVQNTGDDDLEWEAVVQEEIDWLSLSPNSGSLERGGKDEVRVHINRALLYPAAEPYEATIIFNSNGGSKRLHVTAAAQAFTLAPKVLEFGVLTQPTTKKLIVRTDLETSYSLSVLTNADFPWLDVNAHAITVNQNTPFELQVYADPTGLAPGRYEGVVKVSYKETNFTLSVPVTMEVPEALLFLVTPHSINLGDTQDQAVATLTLINEGDGPLTWNAVLPDTADWLAVVPSSGALDAGEELTVGLTAHVTAYNPGKLSETILFNAGTLSQSVRVSVNRLRDPVPDALEAEPRVLNFGSFDELKNISLWNDGPNPLRWSINARTLPSWLTIEPLQGSVEGTQVQRVQLSVDRSKDPEQVSFEHNLIITPSGVEGTAPVEILVRAAQQLFPKIIISGDGVDNANIPFIMIDIGEDSESFVIANEGKSDLAWEIDAAALPGWIVSINPMQGSLAPGRQSTVTVKADRSQLNRDGGSYRIPIKSNDPTQTLSYVETQIRDPYTISIGTRPSTLDFGRDLSTIYFEVANTGDAGYPLDFVVTANQPDWIYVEPARGKSIGRGGEIKDWQFVSVAIDRERISGTGASGKLIISAENVPDNAYPVKPVEVALNVDIAELTIECAAPRVRVPSLIRSNLLLRDIRQRVFPSFMDNPNDDATLYPLNTISAEILENGAPLEMTETNIFIKKDETMSFTVMILLDFSASMAKAAQVLVDDGQLVPGSRSPLEALYKETIGEMIESFPDHYQVALAVFNERRSIDGAVIRILRDAPAGYLSPDHYGAFTTDKNILQYRLDKLHVDDHGATPLFPAINAGATALAMMDPYLLDFDAVANRILVLVSDGRTTTPPGDVSTTAQYLQNLRVRSFSIGWGREVLANPLIQISTESGGHYYAAQHKKVPGVVDENGLPLNIPSKDGLLDRCRPNPDNADLPSIPGDLGAHVTLSYVTLNEEGSVQVQTRLKVEAVKPSVEETLIYDNIPGLFLANDVKLGQIGMKTQGIAADGTAAVQVYMDYAPRNLSRLSFKLTASEGQAWTFETTPSEQGGLVADWNMRRSKDIIVLESSGSRRPLAYGDYGNLGTIYINGIKEPMSLLLEITDPTYNGTPDGKYFTAPAAIDIGYEPSAAFSFPYARFTFSSKGETQESSIFDLGTVDEDSLLEVMIENIGGEHRPTFAQLYWTVQDESDFLPGTLPGKVAIEYNEAEPLNLPFYSLYDANTAYVIPDIFDTDGGLKVAPGSYSVKFKIEVHYGTLPYEFSYGPYYLRYQVQ
ncbi:MAG: VWA domain-containing protein [Candidatus Hydrogenedentes bacterium]|nr:VWA domain-containing protein [Candidatus Hydrogenedentota bacterium]